MMGLPLSRSNFSWRNHRFIVLCCTVNNCAAARNCQPRIRISIGVGVRVGVRAGVCCPPAIQLLMCLPAASLGSPSSPINPFPTTSLHCQWCHTTHSRRSCFLMPNLSGSNIFPPDLGAKTRHNCRFVCCEHSREVQTGSRKETTSRERECKESKEWLPLSHKNCTI